MTTRNRHLTDEEVVDIRDLYASHRDPYGDGAVDPFDLSTCTLTHLKAAIAQHVSDTYFDGAPFSATSVHNIVTGKTHANVAGPTFPTTAMKRAGRGADPVVDMIEVVETVDHDGTVTNRVIARIPVPAGVVSTRAIRVTLDDAGHVAEAPASSTARTADPRPLTVGQRPIGFVVADPADHDGGVALDDDDWSSLAPAGRRSRRRRRRRSTT